MRGNPMESRFGVDFCVTNRCNLACTYCYAGGVVRGGDVRRRLSAAQMKRAVDILVSDRNIRARYGGGFSLGFIGGEPLVEFDAIRETVKYIRAQAADFHLAMNTNGTLLTPDKMAFLAENGVDVYVSVDGNKNTNDLHRKFMGGGTRSVFDAVMGNLRKLIGNAEYKKRLCVSPTFTPNTVPGMPGAIGFLARRLGGLDERTELGINCSILWGGAGRAALRKALREIRLSFLAGLRIGPGQAASYWLAGFAQEGIFISRSDADFMLADTPATLFHDGLFYPFDSTFTTAIDKSWCVGDLERGISLAKIDALRSLPEFADINRLYTGSAVMLHPVHRYRLGKFSGFSRAKLDRLMADTAAVNRVFDGELGQCVKLQLLRRRLLNEPGFGDFIREELHENTQKNDGNRATSGG